MSHLHFRWLIFLLISTGATNLSAQAKKIYTPDDYAGMQTITNRGISAGGHYAWYVFTPMQYGDPITVVHHLKTNDIDTLKRCRTIWVADDGSWIAWKKEPLYAQKRMAQKEKKPESKPADTLIIYTTQGKEHKEYVFGGLKSVELPGEIHGKYIAVLYEMDKKDSLGQSSDTLVTESNHPDREKSTQKDKKSKLKKLVIMDPVDGFTTSYDFVKSAQWSADGTSLAFTIQLSDTLPTHQLHLFRGSDRTSQSVYLSEGSIINLAFSADTKHLAFLEMPDSSDNTTFSAKLMESLNPDNITTIDPSEGMVFNHHHPFYFLERNHKLIVRMSYPTDSIPKDTLLKEERCSVDIWTWNEPILQPQQLERVNQEKKRGYVMVYDPATHQSFQLEDSVYESAELHQVRTNRMVLLTNTTPYGTEATWRTRQKRDLVLADLQLHTKTEIAKGIESTPVISPDDRFMTWYDRNDSSWKSMDLNTFNTRCLTCDLEVDFYDDEFDNPDAAPGYGYSGWGDKGRYLLINSKFDVWKIDLWGLDPAINLTQSDTSTDPWVYRTYPLERKKLYYEGKDRIILSGFNLLTREGGYAELYWNKPGRVNRLTEGAWFITGLTKATHVNQLIWTRENFNTFPDLWVSDQNMKNGRRLSNGGHQYDPFYRGDARLVQWSLPDGKLCEGILYLPENRNPDALLPLMVTFYERSSRRLHRFHYYSPSRSVINIPHYLNDGYAVFVPDIYYGTGTPGKDALEAVVSGTRHVISLGMVDPARIGIQGQSWGGYQVAWIVTRSHLFAAAMAGAPVANMTSAYGAIRKESGRARLFQYESGQSRIGLSLWDEGGLDRYIYDSPLFRADSVQTPLLMMHNDNDGAVPWSQSVEYYLALRRLQKPAWLLVYNNEAHNLTRWPNRIDLSIRMKQFFDHYLKDKPAPKWMVTGIPATMKGVDQGYSVEE